MRQILRIAILSVAVLCLLNLPLAAEVAFARPADPTIPPYDQAAADQVIANVNEWRIQEGLTPLDVNPTLIEMAKSQVAYIFPKIDSITDEADYHKDSAGRMPQARAAAAPYNWPPYGASRQDFRVGENAAIGSVKYALTFWKGSSIHKKTALNPNYREVGAAALKHRFGYVFIMNFGARPNVLPTMIDSTGKTLYLTNDCFCAPKQPTLKTTVQLFDMNGNALSDVLQWSAKVDLPAGASAPLTVKYVNGSNTIFSQVDPVQDLLRLPGVVVRTPTGPTATATPISNNLPTATPSPTATNTRVAAPTFSPLPTNTPRGQVVASAPTRTATPLPTDSPLQTQVPVVTMVSPTPTDSLPLSVITATPLSVPQSAEITLLYNASGLILYNASKKPIDLTDIAIASTDSGRIAVGAWNTVSPFPVSAFPAGHCLVAEAASATTLPANACKYIRSQITVAINRNFWARGTFNVLRGTTILATCQATDQRCDVRLSK